MSKILQAIVPALDLPMSGVTMVGSGELPSCFPVTELASASVGAAALAVQQLIATMGDGAPQIQVNQRLASLWFGLSLQPVGWTLPPLWDAVAGDYACADGWIRLHTNAAHHRKAALAVLGCAPEREAVAAAVSTWRGGELEQAIVAQGGCAAQMRSLEEWRAHPQGQAVAAEPLIAFANANANANANATATATAIAIAIATATVASSWHGTPSRPLAGLKVLDLTRVLAGPVATRFLAGYGADVLRIDPPDWHEPGVIPEVTLGKRCAHLDLRMSQHRDIFESLLAQADVLVHGYSSDALERLGFGSAVRRRLNPALIDVALDTYGWSGPWAGRRGFDSLVQMSCGIAHHGMQVQGANKPIPLPVQALDHATGYLIAAAAVRGLLYRVTEGRTVQARLSLARTALLLQPSEMPSVQPLAAANAADLSLQLEQTAWGPARRYHVPVRIEDAPMSWDRPAAELGSSPPRWDA